MSRPAIWFFNVTRRTLLAFVPVLARPDDDFARSVLSEVEYRLYLGMDPRDRVHGCRIARKLLERQPDARSELVRAALLHDVGKSLVPYRPLHRILAHLYTPVDAPPKPLKGGLAGAWQVKRHHGRYGAEAIRRHGGSPEVARLVERHEDPAGDPEAELLRRLDDET